MTVPSFDNRENECVKTEDGRTVWLSRACAVVAHVCLFNTEDQRWYTLIGQRGPQTPDFQGYWGLPCGYLDWNETLMQAMMREVWEECGVNLEELSYQQSFVSSPNHCINRDNNALAEIDSPWFISDTPVTEKQNISFHYAVLFAWKGKPLPALSADHAEAGEVSDLAWSPMDEVCQMELAFNHANRLQQLRSEKVSWFDAVEKVSSKLG